MLKLNFIESDNYLTPFADLKELNFVSHFKGATEKDFKKWRSEIINKRVPLISEVKKKINFDGEILEIGAGSCWLSAELSKIPEVRHIYALDFSKRVLQEIAPTIIKLLKAKEDKITQILGDFHKLPFNDSSFDFVVIDAALHHTNHLNLVLREIYRVLKSRGRLVAIREPIKSFSWPIKKKFSLVDRHVKKFGVIENTYSKKLWIRYFEEAGFNLSIKPIFFKGGPKENLIRFTPIRFFNGILYSRYYFIASSK